jgi:large subunit ribosomal protein L10
VERAEKRELVATLTTVFKTAGVVVVAHNNGITVSQMNDLRSRMRKAGAAV